MAEKMYYTMGEVAEMLDVTQTLLRFWETKFDIIKPAKNKKGNRLFRPEDVRNLKTIYHLVKERGMTLAGAEKYMKANRGTIGRDMEIAERLQSIRALLVEVRNSLGGDGTVVDDGIEEPASIGSVGNYASARPVSTGVPEDAVPNEKGRHAGVRENTVQNEEWRPAGARESTIPEDIAHIIEEAHEEEVVDALMEDVIEELHAEPDEMPDFDPSPGFEPEPDFEPEQTEEPKPQEPQKPMFIEQTLF